MESIAPQDLKIKKGKVVDSHGHQVFRYSGPLGGGVPGLPFWITKEIAEAEDDEGATLARLEAAIENGNFAAMTQEDLGLDQGGNEVHHDIIGDSNPPDQTGGEDEDNPPDEGGEGEGE